MHRLERLALDRGLEDLETPLNEALHASGPDALREALLAVARLAAFCDDEGRAAQARALRGLVQRHRVRLELVRRRIAAQSAGAGARWAAFAATKPLPFAAATPGALRVRDLQPPPKPGHPMRNP